MRESGNTASDLAKYRIERAEEDYRTAVLLYENGDYRAANNRAYYSICPNCGNMISDRALASYTDDSYNVISFLMCYGSYMVK